MASSNTKSEMMRVVISGNEKGEHYAHLNQDYLSTHLTMVVQNKEDYQNDKLSINC